MTPDPIKKPCNKTFTATRTSGHRNPKAIKWIVVHDTEGGTARGVAAMFAGAGAKASTHLVVDENECYRMLDDSVIPWGATGANTYGYHIEHCGFASWTRGQWIAHDLTLRRGAFKAALRCVADDIPVRWVGWFSLRLGRKGLTTHAEVSKAWPGSGHTDPGPNFPKDVYLAYVKQYVGEIVGL